MIIEGKANRQQSEPDDPRKRLEFNAPEKATRLPVYFALLITGIAAYLKSAFPAQSQSEVPASEDGTPSASTGAPRSGRVAPGMPEIDNELTTGSIGDRVVDNGGGSAGHGALTGSFTLGETLSFNYTVPVSLGPRVAEYFPAAFHYQPQNDNYFSPPPVHQAVQAPDPVAPTNPPKVTSPTPDDDDDEDDDDDPDTDNRAPTVLGPVRLRDVFAGQIVLIGLSELLYGASDPDGDILTINNITATGGTLVKVAAGWSFVTLPGMLGVITFTYNVSDGLLATVQTATLDITRNTVVLTAHADVFVGTPWDDDIDALAGDDIVDARAGNDIVDGGSGDDHINGGDGDDQLFGGLGNDVIFGGAGNDMIGGGAGNDRLFGDDGDDTIEGDQGDDIVMGGAGNDILKGGDGNDMIDGDEGDDIILGGAGDDVADGGTGNDVIEGNEGDDALSGGSGADFIDGGTGDDVIEGNDGDDTLIAAAGDDIVHGGAGDDEIEGDDGDDQIEGNDGDDVLDGGDGSDMMDGGDGDDTLLGGAGDDDIHGGAGDDEIDAGSGNDTIRGDAGRDHIDGGDGHDTLDYSEFTADIHLDFEGGVAWSDQIGDDLFENVEQVIGGQGNDTFEFGRSTAIIAGGGGDDLFVFTVSNDTPDLSRQLVFQILDFVVGDRVHVAEYELSHRAERLEEERFGDIYDELEEGFEAGLPIRVTHAFYDDMDHTIIEADVDRNDFYEISITLDGVQMPLMIGHHVA